MIQHFASSNALATHATCLISTIPSLDADGGTGTVQHFQLLPSLSGTFAEGEILQRYAAASSQQHLQYSSKPLASAGALVVQSLPHAMDSERQFRFHASLLTYQSLLPLACLLTQCRLLSSQQRQHHPHDLIIARVGQASPLGSWLLTILLQCRLLQTAAVANVALLAAPVTQQCQSLQPRPVAGVRQGQQGRSTQQHQYTAHWLHTLHTYSLASVDCELHSAVNYIAQHTCSRRVCLSASEPFLHQCLKW